MELTFQQEVESHPNRKGHLILLWSTLKIILPEATQSVSPRVPTYGFFFSLTNHLGKKMRQGLTLTNNISWLKH